MRLAVTAIALCLATSAIAKPMRVTFYRRGDSNPRLADGTDYGAHGLKFCALNGVPLGSKVKVTVHRTVKSGRSAVKVPRSIILTVRDRTGARVCDVTPLAARHLFGREYVRIGWMKGSVKVISTPRKKR